MQCAWDTLAQFSRKHRQLKGSAAAVGVLHTHSRRLEFHPHVHLAMPGAAFDAEHGLWRSLRKTKKGATTCLTTRRWRRCFAASCWRP